MYLPSAKNLQNLLGLRVIRVRGEKVCVWPDWVVFSVFSPVMSCPPPVLRLRWPDNVYRQE